MHRPMYLTNIGNGEMHHSPFAIALTLLLGLLRSHLWAGHLIGYMIMIFEQETMFSAIVILPC